MPRNQNDIYTKTCLYADFNLKLSYRCPDMRTVWRVCTSKVKGPKNWGNSGVKIFGRTASPGIAVLEIAISDFKWDATVPFVADAGVDVAVPSDVGFCSSGEMLTYGELCGAIYKKRSPQAKPLIKLGSSAMNDPKPNGDWNTLEIGFMARRYSGNTVVKLATVTVKINDTAVLTRIGFLDSMTANRQDDDYLAGPNKGDPIYPGGANWKREFGPIYLQEHDNMVEFKDITINPDWLPMSSGVFDQGWQANPTT